MNLLDQTPVFTVKEARQILLNHFGQSISDCRELASERDQNFQIQCPDAGTFVLKISNAMESRELLEGQNAMMERLAEHFSITPRVIRSISGTSIVTIQKDATDFQARLVTFQEGSPMSAGPFDCRLCRRLGRTVAQLNDALSDFDHPAFHRTFHWDLQQGERLVAERIETIGDFETRTIVRHLLSQFQKHTADHLKLLPLSVIHNDLNDNNVMVGKPDPRDGTASEVTGIIDFGDAVFSWTIGELAIAIAYAILDQSDPLSIARSIVSGYNDQRKGLLMDEELGSLFGLVCMRLCTSVVMAEEQVRANPDNDYLNISQAPIRRTLKVLANISFPFANATLRDTLGRAAVSHGENVCDWLARNQDEFAFPVNALETGIRPAPAQTLVLDLSVSSPLIPENPDAIDMDSLTDLIFRELESANATIAIGRYKEPRILYSSGQFANTDSAAENRTVHLGIDIFSKSGTDVVSPLHGSVFYLGVIDEPLDYGGLVILKHKTDSGDPFCTLYGHLDPSSFETLQIGSEILLGAPFAKLGNPELNGGWTPHLHFQLILDLLDLGRTFPGVAFASQIDTWSAISPDPNLILGIDESCFPGNSPDKQDTLAKRKRLTGPSLSIAYDQSLKIARGWKQYLFDETGRRFLDAYNNVPHVGHCHPHVVQAISSQLAMLNTNTRYLHDNMNDLAERISESMPKGLDVCYFLNSATEANELALRLAREFTSARDLIVLDAAYHGNSTTMIDISPYKHDGPGGRGAPDWVHVVPLPDVYRGKYQEPSTAAAAYANEVKETIFGLEQKLCGFICESCPSVAGQIIFSDGYLPRVYESVRAAGGLCIADDVQTGYGRLGSHMYGFQLQGVIPDIVVLGKPMGNGHPLAAVVTTREIADAFNNGMEFFSTFGGNPVSCAAGIAVLDVLYEEQLQENAEVVGNRILQGLREIQSECSLVGDVRGRGLFLGVELVSDRLTKKPATREARFVTNYCRQRGVLIGTDGPRHNVLKIRPPMCFDRYNAANLLNVLQAALDHAANNRRNDH